MKNRHSFSLISLGCPKALVDSEVLLGRMASSGFLFCEVPAESDVVIINTCCFIEEASRESEAAIRVALALKSEEAVEAVVVFGCMSQRYREDLVAEFPGLDAVIGLDERDSLPDVSTRILSGNNPQRVLVSSGFGQIPNDRPRLRITPRHYAYMRISEGCSNRCAYCTISSIRGPMRSKPIEEVVLEAKELASDGAVEIILIAQDTAAYGCDMGSASRLPALIRELVRIDPIRWIRVLYAHPAHVTEELVDAITESEKVVNYIDIPVQHASDRILENMGRFIDRDSMLGLIDFMRERIDGLVVRTTLMVGFPGETEEDFRQLMSFVRDVEFDRLGAFRYSREVGTRAFDLPGQVPEEVKARRFEELMQAQQEIAFRKNREMVGSVVPAIVDGRSSRKRFVWAGRTYGDAPEIDNKLYIQGESLAPGTIVGAKILAADGYDLFAEMAGSNLEY